MEELYDHIARPVSAWLTVNRACNFRCKWCYGQSSGFKVSDTMDISLAKTLVKIAKDAGVKNINLIGGEPTIWDGIFEINKECKSLGLKTGLITNGCEFSNPSFIEKYQKSPCDDIGVSVKSMNKDVFLLSTGVNRFEDTLQGLSYLFRRYTNGFSTVYNNIVGKNGILEIADKCHNLGAKQMTVSLCSSVFEHKSVQNRYLNVDDIAKDLQDIYKEVEPMYDGNILFEMFLPLCLFPKDFIDALSNKGQMNSLCHLQDRSGIIFDTNGDILPCNTMIGNHILRYQEDFTDGQSLIQALNDTKLVDDYRMLLRYPSPVCSDCSLNTVCRGGCILNWVNLTPDICQAK